MISVCGADWECVAAIYGFTCDICLGHTPEPEDTERTPDDR